MTLLLDTCVISEGVKAKPDASVVRWMKNRDPSQLYLSVITLGEIHFGVAQLPEGRRRRGLEVWLGEVEHDYAGRVIVLDDVIARCWGRLRAANPGVALVDSQIAATAITYGLTLVTRNVKDFTFERLNVLNPWRG